MAGGQERILRRRIRSIQSTKKITKAMELIAASQIIRAQGRIAAARPYEAGMARIVLEAASGDPVAAGHLLGTPETIEKVAVLSMAADRGLCGGYNTSVFRATDRHLVAGEAEGIEYRLFTVGKKAQRFFRFRGREVEQSFTGFSERPSFEDARAVAAAVLTPFANGEVDQVMIVSTRFLSAGTQRVEVRQLLPLVDPRQLPDSAEGDGDGGSAPPSTGSGDGDEARAGYTEFEPDAAELLETLVPRAAETAIFAALLEGSASELTARQRAMAAATDNAEELVKKYSRIMNRARQDTITTEIMEIVGGAEALRAGADEDEGGLVIEARV
ncbi:MAG TPA: ATP synthase F1 subunit gamma [Acidimicrobiales bacterium]|jgi:F-type H+-transporting ATPase subunit gamma|nr:ATP synthase F1 subunit gamma [Acidimicrobiales bacterium]